MCSVVLNRTRPNASQLCARLKAKERDEDLGVDSETRESRRESRGGNKVEVELVVTQSKRGNENLLMLAMRGLYIQAYFLG